ncbi:NAD(P)-binding protein [Artomyces pyxidatus]|uniref:NAD(P)-binding protein n=1 Tax=Artomyces pyxidatus TaxID=48021 RepID=A0ACB8SXX1_9AGAM|nr:NAD(P)-binding protein [Artomyces pyxidatus]
MTTISDDQLFTHASRAKGKVVVLTGGANGIGREAALAFAKYGAKVVIGDLDKASADGVVADIKKAGGEAVFSQCNVLDWDAQVDLFELAISKYGAVDIVVPNAGINEAADLARKVEIKDGRPVRPAMLTMQINLTAVLHTVHLGLHYMTQNRAPGDWKSIVLIGSMASWQAIPLAPQYSASKHAILGLMRSLHLTLAQDNIRLAVVHPWFAGASSLADTKILPVGVKVVLAGIPLTPVSRIAGAIVCAAVDPDPATAGCPYVLPDDGPVMRLDKEKLTLGVYKLLDERVQRIESFVESVKFTVATVADISRIFGKGLIVVPVVVLAIAVQRGLVTLPF